MDITKLSPVEKKRLQEIMIDPVLWAKAFVRTFDGQQKKVVPWTARWYQVEMLRDNSLKKVARCGRRTGKCLPGWVEVFDPVTGQNVKMKDIFEKGEANVVTMNEHHKLVAAKTSAVMDNGVKEVFKVKLKSGKEIDATGNHPLYTVNGWEEIDDLKPGDMVAAPKNLDHFKSEKRSNLLQSSESSDITWEEILSIESIGMHQTYDLTIPVTHNFVANDIIVHNTETMCIDSLHKTYTKPKTRVLFVTPYENQVRLIFMRLRELIDTSDSLKSEVEKMTSNPYQIIWKNGAAIMGFTTGASSGSGGASIRGQRADYVFMDEVDYMSEADFDTVTTIAAERDDIGVFMSSTPTGKRSKFYEACTNKAMGYTEHYHPSSHNPNWNIKMEEEFRAQLSEQGYTHEIEAEFGTQDTGVFDKKKLDQSCEEEYYFYEKLSSIQQDKIDRLGVKPNSYVYPPDQRAPMNPFRTMGVKQKLLPCIETCR